MNDQEVDNDSKRRKTTAGYNSRVSNHNNKALSFNNDRQMSSSGNNKRNDQFTRGGPNNRGQNYGNNSNSNQQHNFNNGGRTSNNMNFDDNFNTRGRNNFIKQNHPIDPNFESFGNQSNSMPQHLLPPYNNNMTNMGVSGMGPSAHGLLPMGGSNMMGFAGMGPETQRSIFGRLMASQSQSHSGNSIVSNQNFPLDMGMTALGAVGVLGGTNLNMNNLNMPYYPGMNISSQVSIIFLRF